MSHFSRLLSEVRMNAPFRVPTSTLTPLVLSAMYNPLRVRSHGVPPNRHKNDNYFLSGRHARKLDHRANLNCPVAGARNASGDPDRLVQIVGIDQEVAAQLLAGF